MKNKINLMILFFIVFCSGLFVSCNREGDPYICHMYFENSRTLKFSYSGELDSSDLRIEIYDRKGKSVPTGYAITLNGLLMNGKIKLDVNVEKGWRAEVIVRNASPWNNTTIVRY